METKNQQQQDGEKLPSPAATVQHILCSMGAEDHEPRFGHAHTCIVHT